MITHTIHNLRTADWRCIDRHELREHLQDCTHQVIRWHTGMDHYGRRSYLVMTSEGALFLVTFRRVV
jgi:hypothetical protein